MPVKYLDEFFELKLPKDGYALFGSACLAIRGIRENNDIDILVKDELWEKLKKNRNLTGRETLEIGHVEIGGSSNKVFNEPCIEQIIDEAEIIDGIRYAKLEHVLFFKKKRGKEKDLQDIKLIEDYLEKKS